MSSNSIERMATWQISCFMEEGFRSRVKTLLLQQRGCHDWLLRTSLNWSFYGMHKLGLLVKSRVLLANVIWAFQVVRLTSFELNFKCIYSLITPKYIHEWKLAYTYFTNCSFHAKLEWPFPIFVDWFYISASHVCVSLWWSGWWWSTDCWSRW